MGAQTHRDEPKTVWETFEHGADVGVRGFGSSLGEAFGNTAMAMTSVVTDPAVVKPARSFPVSCSAPDLETLLFDWLNALIFQMSVETVLFSKFDVNVEGLRLTATAWGEPVDRKRHQPAAEPKGATFTTAKVEQDADGIWRAQCVVDV
jgi:SHS2 domain-containing protein